MTTPPSATGKASRHRPSACAEAEVRREERVRLLPRQERRGARNPDHERVERLVEGRPPQLDRAEQRLGVRHRRWPREHRSRRPRRRAASGGRGGERPPARRAKAAAAASARSARLPRGRTDSRARTPGNCGWLRTSETPKSGTRAASARSTSVAEPPALGAARLEERLGRRAALRLGVGGGEQRRRAAVQDGLRRAHHDDEVGLDELARDPHPRRAGGNPDERGVGGIVHRHSCRGSGAAAPA